MQRDMVKQRTCSGKTFPDGCASTQTLMRGVGSIGAEYVVLEGGTPIRRRETAISRRSERPHLTTVAPYPKPRVSSIRVVVPG